MQESFVRRRNNNHGILRRLVRTMMEYREFNPARRRPKRVLAVRVLVARVSWLEGKLRWRNGKVIWQHGEYSLAPEARDLARTQRCLNRIEDYPRSAELALGDPAEWLHLRRERLELAKTLRTLSVPDLNTLAKQARQ